MKITFYCDVPPYWCEGTWLYAYNHGIGSKPPDGYRRVAFAVEIPIKRWDEFAQATPAVEIESSQTLGKV